MAPNRYICGVMLKDIPEVTNVMLGYSYKLQLQGRRVYPFINMEVLLEGLHSFEKTS